MAITKVSRGLLNTGVSDSSDATAITIDSSERVMIGTTDSGYPDYGDSLTLGDVDGGGGNSGMTIRSGTSSYGTFYFSDATGTAAGTYAGKMQYNHSNNSMIFGTNSADRVTIDLSGNVSIAGGNLVIGTSGKGIDFGSTSDGSGSSSSEVFDDYEEGTWSPTFAGVATAASYGATYIKIGRQVIAECYIAGNTQNNTNQFQLGGLPYTSANETTYGGGSISYVGSVDLSEFADPIVVPNGNYVYFHYIDGSQGGNSVTNNVLYNKEAGNILFLAQFIYRAAS